MPTEEKKMEPLTPAELSRLGDLNYRGRSLRQVLTDAQRAELEALWTRWRATALHFGSHPDCADNLACSCHASCPHGETASADLATQRAVIAALMAALDNLLYQKGHAAHCVRVTRPEVPYCTPDCAAARAALALVKREQL